MAEDFTPPERISFDQELTRYSRAVPFSPFDIVTAGGTTYSVTDAIQIGLTPDAVVVVPPKAGLHLIRRELIVAVHVRGSDAG